MKKSFLLVPAFSLGLLMALNFSSCSNDEADGQQSKAELLLQKSKEFEKKYGVGMELNPDSLDEIAQTLTVEQMEEDYRRFAALNAIMQGRTIEKQTKTRNKLRIRKVSADYEDTQIKGVFEFKDPETEIKGSCSYTIGNLGSGTAYVSIRKDDESTCSGTFPITGVTENGNKEGYSFHISGTIWSNEKYYKIKYVVDITCKPNGNIVHVSSQEIRNNG